MFDFLIKTWFKTLAGNDLIVEVSGGFATEGFAFNDLSAKDTHTLLSMVYGDESADEFMRIDNPSAFDFSPQEIEESQLESIRRMYEAKGT